MDFSFMRNIKVEDDFEIKHPDIVNKSNSADVIMEDNWSSSDDILNSLFHDNDFLNNFDGPQPGFDSLEQLSECIKMEAENYEISDQLLPPTLLDDSKFISSNSSDSGLSSDNLDIEMSPAYEPLSPAMSSPGPSVSERGVKNSPPRNEVVYSDFCPSPQITQKLPTEKIKPKVIVQKVPQVVSLSRNDAVNLQQKLNLGMNNSKEFKIVKLSPQMFNTANNKKVTIQMKNPTVGNKIQAKPGTLFINKGKLTEVKKLVRVQNPNNPRSILIPVSLQDMKDVRTFKIINTNSVKSTPVSVTTTATKPVVVKVPKTISVSPQSSCRSYDDSYDQMSDTDSIIIEDGYEDDKPDDDDCDTAYPKLVLSAEEKRLLGKEGISLPSHYPLTKHEERELKRIRRKIRNKISAQDSRKRKKEYVDGLEERVKQCTEENQSLMKRIKQLQSQNQNLMTQMKKLQTLLSKGTNKTTNPTTCLMVLLMSLALVAAPNLKLGQNVKESDLEEAVQDTILQNRRNLLFDVKDQQNSDIFDEEINMSDIISMAEYNAERENAAAKASGEPSCKKLKLSADFVDFDVDDQNWYKTKSDMAATEKKIQETYSFDDSLQQNIKTIQTSGFNIDPDNGKNIFMDDTGNWLDKDILDMITPTANGVYELNLDKLSEGYLTPPESVVGVGTKQVYGNNGNNKLNASEMRNVQKY